MESVKNKKQVSYVVIPDDDSTLEENLQKAPSLGFKNLVADPIIAPPFKTASSLSDYHSFREANDMPIMMGIANVVEMIDADSIGINAFLATVAIELKVSLILTTESSHKTRNSIRELKRALELCLLGKAKGSLPKDLGLDLLIAKSKSGGEIIRIDGVDIVDVTEGDSTYNSDKKGYFKILVDFDKGKIIAAHHDGGYTKVFEGSEAEPMIKHILKEGLVSNMEHAAYLGRELQKAELYLKMKKSYVQDEDFLAL
jgi:dihydropteroate synthase-like protein